MITPVTSGRPICPVGSLATWAGHAKTDQLSDIPVERLKHVIYTLADVSADGGSVLMNKNEHRVNFRRRVQRLPKC